MEVMFWGCGGSEKYCEDAGTASLKRAPGGWEGVASPAIYSCDAVPHQCSSFAQMAIMCNATEAESPLTAQFNCTREGQRTVNVQKEVRCALPVDLRGEEVPWNGGYACDVKVSSIAAPRPPSAYPSTMPSHTRTPASKSQTPVKTSTPAKSPLTFAVIVCILLVITGVVFAVISST